MSFQRRYANLNPAQKLAVDTIDGPVMVVAGPGTGKTELLSVRAANILQKTDTLPENILCLTFTESGQAAMRERLVSIIGKDAYKVAIHTFHSFGSEVMSQNRDYFYRNALFQPADELKQYEIMHSIFETLEPTNPLSSSMNGEYTHLRDAQSVISELKRRSALTSDELLAVLTQNDEAMDKAERLLVPILSERVGKTTAAKLQEAAAELADYARTVEPLYQITPVAKILSDSLYTMLADTETVHPTKPISAWKSRLFERDAAKNLVLKDRKKVAKLKAVSYIYYEYLNRMEKAGLFDFDDMIMQVVHAVEVNDDLRFNLQEKYLYIMVDEFQDTNPAQLRILNNLTDNPVNEGAPNILVVGDDDQAIYGFQGADISNILNFSDLYPTRQLVVLTENYRSGAPILEASRAIIAQAGDRLEDRIPELDKKLHAQSDEAAVSIWQAPHLEGEYHAVAADIKRKIEAGIDPSSIAVLARKHADIQTLLPYLSHADIVVRYEREESVLDSPPIKALEGIAELIVALADGRHDHVETLLPQVLAHPAWGIEAQEIWRLSLDAYKNRQNWMEILATTPRFVSIHTWLVEQAEASKATPLEPMVDRLMGKPAEDDDTFHTPYFSYFFSTEALESNPQAYLQCLLSLRTLRSRLSEYQPDTTLALKDLVSFIELHRRLNITLLSRQYSLASDVPAVQLLTAHKSKGLEFDHVYIINSVDSSWGQGARGVSRSISYPENLPLQSGGNSADERLRLYYVAATRARKSLVMSFADVSENGKQTLVADFLVQLEAPLQQLQKTTDEIALEQAELAWWQPLARPTADLKTLLAPQLEKFKLSATSFNAFLDVTRGGPQAFLLNNLLHFPKTKAPSASYGTAIHWTMQQAHTHLTATGEQKPLEDVLHDFETALTKERLSEKDTALYLQKGSQDLPQFLASNVLPITASQKAEVDFKHQDVVVSDARLTGSLDMLDINVEEKSLVVTDYKTGKPSESWTRGDDHTKLKLHKYKQQLLFYKLLVENSSAYGTYKVTHGQLAFIEPTKAGESIVLSLDLNQEDIEHTRALIEAVWKRIILLDLPDTSGYSDDFKGVLAFEQDLIDETV